MLISYNWLRELVPELDVPASQLATDLTHAGLAVDSIRSVGQGLQSVLIAQVTEVVPHPSKSNLQLVTVDRGDRQTLRVVCGASNVPPAGGRVVLAPSGTYLPALDVTLAPREIGGVRSEGMLCSERELGLSDESRGIFVLQSELTAGTVFEEAFPFASDTILEIDVTPNRPDALGHVGVARDLAARYGLDFSFPRASSPRLADDIDLKQLIRIDNEEPELCPVYGASAVVDVNIEAAPDWMRWRLHSLAVRPISNVVDITNWLLLLFGQPMHAFDLDRVEGRKIVIRRARTGEAFTTLDGVARKLDEQDLMICDAHSPSALAGIMGGQNSEINQNTKRVLLECAYFAPAGIRKSSRRHALHTESSHRFERGVDYGAIPEVLEHAKKLICELAGGRALPGALFARGKQPDLSPIRLSARRLNALLGIQVPFEEALDGLRRLGFESRRLPGADVADVRLATFRPDVRIEVDLIEEVARMRGLDEIPTVLPAIKPQKPRQTERLVRRLGAQAVALGLSEAVTYTFVSARELKALGAPPPAVTLRNPLSEARSVMQTNVLPGLLEALARARRRGETEVRLFTIATCFLPPETKERASVTQRTRPRLANDQSLPEERPMLGIVLAGSRREYLTPAAPPLDVFDAKGLVLELLERITFHSGELRPAESRYPHLHPRGAADVYVAGQRVGRLGPLHPDVIEELDLSGTALVAEIDLVDLERIPEVAPVYHAIPKLPAVARDLSLVVSDEVSAGELLELVKDSAGQLCESVELTAEFVGGSVPAGHRSLTFRVVFRDPRAAAAPEEARTLTDAEVEGYHQNVVTAAQHKFGASLRS